MSPRLSAPSIASMMAWVSTSASLWPVESAIVGENYTPEDEGPSFYQTVNVVAVADAKLHLGQETLRFLSFLLPIVTWAVQLYSWVQLPCTIG